MPRQTSFILSPRSRLTCLYSCRDAVPTRIALHCPPGARSPFLLGSVPAFEVGGPERVQLRVLLVVQFAVGAFATLVQPVLNVVLVQRVVRFGVEPVRAETPIMVSAGAEQTRL
jgi:hypothetical protein